MPLAAVFVPPYHAPALPGPSASGGAGKGGLFLSLQCNGQSIQACADMPVLVCAFCFCLLFVLTAANNYIIPLQR